MMKDWIYAAFRKAGFFKIARQTTAEHLRILAYHGFEFLDEARFRPGLFMNADVFRQRMKYLVQAGFPILPISEAIERLKNRNLPPAATVITFDDGFYSIWKKAVPILLELKLPATIYVTTYYCIKRNPIFRLVVQYMFWKTARKAVDFTGLGLGDLARVRLDEKMATDRLMWRIIGYGENEMGEEGRVQLSYELGRRLDVDYEEIVRKRFLTIMTESEIQEAARLGVDIQLHTHRHVLPIEPELLKREIEQNREILEPLVGQTLEHLCYPSGIYSERHLIGLKELGVVSATTCTNGLNHYDTHPLALYRFLDGNHISEMGFEAEMSGFAELRRKAGSSMRQIVGSTNQIRKGIYV